VRERLMCQWDKTPCCDRATRGSYCAEHADLIYEKTRPYRPRERFEGASPSGVIVPWDLDDNTRFARELAADKERHGFLRLEVADVGVA